MDRRDFFAKAIAAGLTGKSQMAVQINVAGPADITIERTIEGTPHKGKVLALITLAMET